MNQVLKYESLNGPVTAIKYTGKNLKEVLDLTGRHERFDEWFPSFEDYEKYVHEHGDLFKIFKGDNYFYVAPGEWIIRSEDGYLWSVTDEAFQAAFVEAAE